MKVIEHFCLKDFPNLSIEKNDSNGLSMHAKNQPYLISIEDTGLIHNGINIFPLKEGKTYLGPRTNEVTSTAHQQIDIYIHGEHSGYLHRLDSNKVYLRIINGEFQLNEQKLHETNDEYEDDGGVELKHGDLLLAGDVDMFKFVNPFESSELLVSSFSKKNSLKNLVRNYFSNAKKYEFLDDQTNALNEKVLRYETLIDEQREKLLQMSEQIELNNLELSKMKELNLANKKQNELEHKMLDIVEKFERDEQLLSDCFQELNKSQESQFRSYIFELQNLKLREQELEFEQKRNRVDIEKVIFYGLNYQS